MHNLFGFSVDYIDDLFRNLSIRCNAMLQPHCPKQANANTPEILLKFSTLPNLSDPEDSVFYVYFFLPWFYLQGYQIGFLQVDKI